MKQKVPDKESSHKDRFPHKRLTLAGDLSRIWGRAARGNVRLESETVVYQPLDRELVREASCALNYGFRQKDERDFLAVGIHAPQLHRREIKGGVLRSGSNCHWLVDESPPKRRNVIDRLDEAANKGDEPTFLKCLEEIKWQDLTAADIVRVIKLAFRAGAFKAACYIASEGVKVHPDNVDVQKYARILSPTTRKEEATPTANTDTRTNRQWLKEHAGEYQGQWIALRNGELLGASRSLNKLTDEVSRKYGVTFPSREVMITAVD